MNCIRSVRRSQITIQKPLKDPLIPKDTMGQKWGKQLDILLQFWAINLDILSSVTTYKAGLSELVLTDPLLYLILGGLIFIISFCAEAQTTIMSLVSPLKTEIGSSKEDLPESRTHMFLGFDITKSLYFILNS